ncbi:GNAT family N-acetyltransferase [Oscillatoria sp. FACHB-1406]|nr:GNAT family N-acetyltransferase [Oscillatoria sp. FACHB-1406]
MNSVFSLKLRLATLPDADRISVLSDRLGYPTTEAQMRERLQVLLRHDDHAIYVATTEDDRAIAWIHVHRCYLAIEPTSAFILGLIVDEEYRGCGAGRRLVECGEQWGKERGCDRIVVRSNIIRPAAHRFYQHLGYANIKQSMVFAKDLSVGAS